MRGNLKDSFPEDTDFFEYVTDVVIKCMLDTYDMRRQFSQYTFEHGSLTEQNRVWWTGKIVELAEEAKKRNLIRQEVDSESLAYFIWCVCRGINTDAAVRKLSKIEAVKNLKEGFGYILEGIRVH